jgi:signal transduction histidine kinase
LLPWATVAIVLSGVTANVLRLRGDVSIAGPSLGAQVLEVAAGAALILVAGSVRGGRRRWLIAAAGVGWLVAEWANPAAPGSFVFTVGLIAAISALPFAVAARSWRWPVLMWPLVLAAAATAVVGGPLAAATASPTDEGCTDCARDLIAVSHNVARSAQLTRLGNQLAVATGVMVVVALIAVTGKEWRRAALSWSPDRAADVAAAGFAAAVAIGALVTLRDGAADPLIYRWHDVASAALLGLALSAAVPAWRAARAMRVVARATVAIADDPGGSAVDTLRAALGDEALQVAYTTPDGIWRDRHGQSVDLPDQHVTLVTDLGESVAALIHHSSARIDQAAVAGAISGARILLDTERIEAGALARVDDLRTARRLAVEAGDVARASLERDLHDGTQQRLVVLRYALGLASMHAAQLAEPDLSARLAEADRDAERALAELRDLAHGFSAATVAVEGLASAVHTAAESSPVPIRTLELPTEPLPESVERAAYRFIADCIKEAARASATGLTIAVRPTGLDVVVEVEYDGAIDSEAWPPAYVSDRLAAAGGQLRSEGHNSHSRLIASLPCG